MLDRYNLVSELKKKYTLASPDERKKASSVKPTIKSGSAFTGASAAKNATTGTSGLWRGSGVRTPSATQAGKVTGKVSGNTGVKLIPSDEDRAQFDRVDRLSADFPFDRWDDMTTKEQLKAMQNSGLSLQDQWWLLNTPISLQTLELMNAALKGQNKGALSGQEATDLFNRAYQFELDKQQLNRTDASILPPLQKNLLRGELKKKLDDIKARAGKLKDDQDSDFDKPTTKDTSNEKPNSKLVEMFNYGYEEPYTLKEGEFYYVEEATVFGSITGIALGKTILFNEDKYAVYNYIGYSAGASIANMPFNHIWSRGIVSNVYNVKDYKGSFFNSSALAGPSGYSISVGKNSEGEMVFARSDAAEEWFPTGNINAGYQWYSSKTDHWIFDTAPIEWADTIWDNMMSLYPYDT